MNAIILIFSILFQSILAYGGFAAHTPVMLSTGEHVAIKDIRIGDTVVCHDGKSNYIFREVTDIHSRLVHDCVCVILENSHIITACNQKLYLANHKRWKMAGCLLPGDLLLGESGETIPVKCVLKIPRPVQLYDLTVAEYHNFLVSKRGVVAQNIVPAVAIGVSIAFGSGAFELAGITLGVGALTLGMNGLVNWLNNRREEEEFWKADPVPNVQAQQNQVYLQDVSPHVTAPVAGVSLSSGQTQTPTLKLPATPAGLLTFCPSTHVQQNSLAEAVKTTIVDSVAQTAVGYASSKLNNKDKTKGKEYAEALVDTEDDDDECPHHIGCTKKHPFGLYEDAGYHHKNSVGDARGGKSPALVDGQTALDCSFNKSTGNSVQRLGASCGQLVNLNRTQRAQLRNGRIVDIWHGHVTQWDDLERKHQNVLKDKGMANKNHVFK